MQCIVVIEKEVGLHMFKHHYRQLPPDSRRRQRISPLMLLGFIGTMILALMAAEVPARQGLLCL
jgi:hypothetical protein